MKQSNTPLISYSYSRRNEIALCLEEANQAGSPVDAYICSYLDIPEIDVIAEVIRVTNNRVAFKKVEKATMAETITELYRESEGSGIQYDESFDAHLAQTEIGAPRIHDLLEEQENAPIVRSINSMLTDAVTCNASDIHIESFRKRLDVRFRVDGFLREYEAPPKKVAQLLASRIKVMSQLDIAEKRVPQDGRMAVHVAGRHIDIRVSTLPTNHGERIVLRILEKEEGHLDLAQLGASKNQIDKLKSCLSSPNGILLVTGPTGSGKSTTLYSALSYLHDGTKNILTIEDPVEYDLSGIGQAQVNQKIDMTFARGLRAILRQDPDIVMVGEIRDKETAEIAVQASMTGHLVLSTLHTNSAIGAVTRLADIGIEPFLLSSSIVAVIGQRLVRKLCPVCKEPSTKVHAAVEPNLNTGDIATYTYRAVGCDHCFQTGYLGRTAIYELIKIDEEMRALIASSAPEHRIEELARLSSNSLFEDGIAKVNSGVTSIEEITRVTTAIQGQ
ncbi:MAG: GspE/PulE family protein [Halioglobus sp.]